MTSLEIQHCLATAFPNSSVQVSSDDEVHFNAIVVSELFIGKSRLQQQQMVYQVLNPYLNSGAIHAISLKTFTTAEWAKTNG